MERERKQKREDAAATQVVCEMHRTRLAQIEPNRRVFYTDDSGEQRRMDDDKRVGLVEESKDFLAKNCY